MRSKKLSKSGAIVIPKEMRVDMGLHPGTGIDLTQDKDAIIIKPHVPICRFCGSVENVTSVLEIEICADCAAKIYEAVVTK